MDRPYFSAEAILIEMFGTIEHVSRKRIEDRASEWSDASFLEHCKERDPVRYSAAITRLKDPARDTRESMDSNVQFAFTAQQILAVMFGAIGIDKAKARNGCAIYTDEDFVDYMRSYAPSKYKAAIDWLDTQLDAANGIVKAQPAIKGGKIIVDIAPVVGTAEQIDISRAVMRQRAFIDTPTSNAAQYPDRPAPVIAGKMDAMSDQMAAFVDALSAMESALTVVLRPSDVTVQTGDTGPIPPKPSQSAVAHSLDDLIGQCKRATNYVIELTDRIEV